VIRDARTGAWGRAVIAADIEISHEGEHFAKRPFTWSSVRPSGVGAADCSVSIAYVDFAEVLPVGLDL
jgi:hypothetical protein